MTAPAFKSAGSVIVGAVVVARAAAAAVVVVVVVVVVVSSIQVAARLATRARPTVAGKPPYPYSTAPLVPLVTLSPRSSAGH